MCKIVFKNEKYYLVDKNQEVECKVIQPKGWKPTIELPENSSNRHYVNLENFHKKAIDNELALPHRETRVLGERQSSIPKKPDVEWLDSAEDRQTFQTLLDKIAEAKKKAKEEANRPLTEKEKLERLIKKYQEKLNNLED